MVWINACFQLLSQGSQTRLWCLYPPEQHYSPQALSHQHLQLVYVAAPRQRLSKRAALFHTWHVAVDLFPWHFITQLGFSITVEHLWIFKQTLHLHPEASGAQIISGWISSTWRTLCVSRSTRWNVPPVYPVFSYYKPLPTNGFLLWTTKLNIVHCVYVFRWLSSSLWSVETGSFL